MIDLRSVIASLGVSTFVQVERPSAGTWTDGIFSGGYTVLSLTMAVQPLGRKTKLAPEGVRADDVIVIYCTEELKTARDPDGGGGDRIRWNGYKWEVQTLEDWTTGEQGGFYKAIAIRLRD